jgi:hypothetical protein
MTSHIVAPGTLPAAGFELRLPEHWFDLSVADEASENSIARRTWEQCRAAGFDEAEAGRFTESVRRSVRQARRSGALHAGGTFELYDDGPLTATIVVASATPPANGDVVGALLAPAEETPATSTTWHRIGTAELPGIGTAARVHGVHDVALDGETMRCVFMHTVVRIPASAGVLVVTGSSPNLAEADELFELFATVTATLRFTEPR